MSAAPPCADLLVVDDQEQVRTVLVRILEAAGYTCRAAGSVAEAEVVIGERVPDLVLCDIDMPVESGLVLVERLHRSRPEVGVLMVTAFDDPAVADTAMDDGALGYVVKPFDRNEILINVAGALRHHRQALATRTTVSALEAAVAQRTSELRSSVQQLDVTAAALDRSYEDALRRLASAAEARDDETACHLERMSRYSELLAGLAGLPADRVEMVRLASPLHDVGKIGVPDEVLMKPGVFDDSDRIVMQRHPRIGYELLAGSGSPLLELAATIAYTHHEWYDGSGYPRGLQGEHIPLEGRIVAIADVYDALTSARRYKDALSQEAALEIMQRERGTHFDPALLDLFVPRAAQLEEIRTAWLDANAVCSVDG